MPFIDITSAPNFPIVFMVGLVAFVCLSAMCKTSAPAVTCTTPGCNKPTWNGKQGAYCTKGCRTNALVAAAAADAAAAAATPAPTPAAAFVPTPAAATPAAALGSEPLHDRQKRADERINAVADTPRKIDSTVDSLKNYVSKPIITMLDPRDSAKEVGVGAFYLPDKEERWDKICSCGFCGNFQQCGKDGKGNGLIKVTGNYKGGPSEERSFTNTEAAFQALKYWKWVDEFTSASGDQAFQAKKGHMNKTPEEEDWTYGGTGSNWKAMFVCLRAKFEKVPMMQKALLATGDLYLVEHNAVQGRDLVWSDNNDGSGTNWLGLQCMLLRDELSGKGEWTNFISQHIDITTGKPLNPMTNQWQKSVKAASDATKIILRESVAAAAAPVAGPVCQLPGCGKPTWNGQTGYCTQGHRTQGEALFKAGPVCVHGCAKNTWNGVNGQPCRDCALKPAVCITPGCVKPTYNGQHGEKCSRSCGGALVQHAAPGVFMCPNPGCSKQAWKQAPGECCGKTCRLAVYGTPIDQ